MKIAIDIDEVVVEFVRSYLKFIDKKGISGFSFEDIISYKMSDILNIGDMDFLESLDEYNSSKYFDEARFIDGAKKSVEYLENNHDIFFITARSQKIKNKTRKFIFEEFNILGNKVLFAGNIVNKGKSKDDICKEMEIKVIIEDNGEDSLKYAKNGLKVLLLDKPWNKKFSHDNIFRCFSWNEILERVEELEGLEL